MNALLLFGSLSCLGVAQSFESAWNDLGSDDAAVAYQTIVRLTRSSEPVPQFLYVKMRASRRSDYGEVDRLIADLDGPSFQARQAAAQRLKELGKRAEARLLKAAKNGSVEFRRRTEEVLEGFPAERVRDARALEVLERIGDDAAKEVLRKLASEWEGTSFEQEIRSTFRRLGERNPK